MWRDPQKDSGKCLNEVDAYKHWIDRSSAEDFLPMLTDKPGTGKSFLVSPIAQDIKNIATCPWSGRGQDGDRQLRQ